MCATSSSPAMRLTIDAGFKSVKPSTKVVAAVSAPTAPNGTPRPSIPSLPHLAIDWHPGRRYAVYLDIAKTAMAIACRRGSHAARFFRPGRGQPGAFDAARATLKPEK